MNEHVTPTTASETDLDELGLNAWFVEDKHQEYLANPSRVDDDWREYFGNGNGHHASAAPAAPTANGATPPPAIPLAAAPAPAVAVPVAPAEAAPAAAAQPAAAAAAPAAQPAAAAAAPAAPPAPPLPAPSATGSDGEEVTPIRGAQARIVDNMVTSLGVPTATSFHPLPAKVLEVNRRILNEHLARTTGQKISFTHLIAYAAVRALDKVPALNVTFVPDADGKGTPGVIRHEHVGLGIAIDLERPGGGRSLVVPAVKRADTLDFAAFVAAYEDLVARARVNKLTVEDFSGVTITLTNPGGLGTSQSVPRLMAGQGAIIGVGSLDFPVEYAGTDPATLADLGVGKVLSLSSTYDHRVVQGAESGLFLKHVHELLVGDGGFYDELFEGLGVSEPPAHWQRDRRPTGAAPENAGAVRDLVAAYRLHGHLAASLDPLAPRPPAFPDVLLPEHYGLTLWDLDRTVATEGVGGAERATLEQLLAALRRAYCGTVGVEAAHISDDVERRFVQEAVEAPPELFSADEQRYLFGRLAAAESFERFLQVRYPAERRFSLEGGDSAIVFLDALLEESVAAGTTEAVLAMAHRGRLNALANIVDKPYSAIFSDFEHNLDPLTVEGAGDVKYHKGGHGKWVGRGGESMLVELASNPSHLEAVNPVVEGIVRAKIDHRPGESYPVLPILVHGDASFAGQGVVAETFNLSLVDGYAVGGTVHLVINNQLGFTTSPASGRSTRYATDVAKMVEAPILHVNGDDPEAVARVARLAARYRTRFHKDVVVDLVCYRLHGHNEGDDPSYTQPLMYRAIEAHPSVRTSYQERLVAGGVLTAEEAEAELQRLNQELAAALVETRAIPHPDLAEMPPVHAPPLPPLSLQSGVDRAVLDALAWRLHHAPEDFHVHPKLLRQLELREELYASGEVDWALAEGLAYGSLLYEGTDIRLTGQDARRGTFSHRHAVLTDVESGAEFTPLAALAAPQGAQGAITGEGAGRFEVHDSVLSEYAALGFEYGYAVEDPSALVIWEAQFGDFANGAQIMIDNFIVAGGEKWGQSPGLVLLLPHGYEGQGAEHSSARIERYLQLAAKNNLAIVQPTTAAQIFHLLRAQSHRAIHCPLIVFTPKSLLRARTTRSPVEDLVDGSFHEVLDDPAAGETLDRAAVERVVLCTGKIGVETFERRDAILAAEPARGRSAVVRLEQLYPFPATALRAVLDRYPAASELVWVQDEPENMGAWSYVREPLEQLNTAGLPLRRVTRPAAGSPATGSHLLHELERDYLLDHTVGTAPAKAS
ncbi:MAG TPA: multifunctional oxoglutarate decarboxylase/oxoglutarate dehydrogenase thiamine pyrophosphate-binding subunit/dihydrolipoyllysine-residue succinyltransferase subunit [Acidimicrobiales bacterium]|nr:multifunctional oxoglutarate decarboxylase/oxoglutarate dehydrogenase thiamine pyrophosphate-binding subunit/dihydrolipoyllysine-residue succinyltransferase subunit [Acidimicrobiales bacterium]